MKGHDFAAKWCIDTQGKK